MWISLGAADAGRAYHAICTFVDWPSKTLAYLKPLLQPAARANPKLIDQWIVDLENDEFEVRDKAEKALEIVMEVGEPQLKKALAKATSPDVRRHLLQLLDKSAD